MERGYPVFRYNVNWSDIQREAQYNAERSAMRAAQGR
jgi:hypothetical protein